MSRGNYSAWVYVGVAFFYQMIVLALTLGMLIGGGAGVLALWLTNDRGVMSVVIVVALALSAAGGSWLIFRDRWRCIEAFSSRYCSGLMNLSLVYVPFIAVGYATVRGVRKLRRR